MTFVHSSFSQYYYSYQKGENTLIYPNGERAIDNIMESIAKFWSPGMRQVLPKFFKSQIYPMKRVKITEEEYLYLKVILLCNPSKLRCYNTKKYSYRNTSFNCYNFNIFSDNRFIISCHQNFVERVPNVMQCFVKKISSQTRNY